MAEQNLSHRVKPGDKSIPAGPLNQAFDAAEQILSGRTRGPSIPSPLQFNPHVIKVRNITNAARARGEIVRVGSAILDDARNDGRWFLGERLDVNDYVRTIGVLLDPQPHQTDSSTPGRAVIAGICVAKVNVTDITHTYAHYVFSTDNHDAHMLQSAVMGRAMLLSEPAETGEQDCLIQLNILPRATRYMLDSAAGASVANGAFISNWSVDEKVSASAGTTTPTENEIFSALPTPDSSSITRVKLLSPGIYFVTADIQVTLPADDANKSCRWAVVLEDSDGVELAGGLQPGMLIQTTLNADTYNDTSEVEQTRDVHGKYMSMSGYIRMSAAGRLGIRNDGDDMFIGRCRLSVRWEATLDSAGDGYF